MFHLTFLQVLPTKLQRDSYVLEGGANLRYFLDSNRYSEDIDLDLVRAEPWRVRRQVGDVFESPALTISLRSGRLLINEVNEHKQTDTTLRWKLSLDAPGHSTPIRTKIEFSNRNGDSRISLDPVPSRIMDAYPVAAPLVQHYTGPAALEQKVGALAHRADTQTRDVFDLDLLLRTVEVERGSIDSEELEEASNRALELTFDSFESHVIPFLEPEIAELYDETRWEQMQLYVYEKLEAAK